MSAVDLRVGRKCRSCNSALSLDEMHYYDHGDGTATCDKCEAAWCEAVEAWRHGAGDEDDEMPPRP